MGTFNLLQGHHFDHSAFLYVKRWWIFHIFNPNKLRKISLTLNQQHSETKMHVFFFISLHKRVEKHALKWFGFMWVQFHQISLNFSKDCYFLTKKPSHFYIVKLLLFMIFQEVVTSATFHGSRRVSEDRLFC